MSAQRRGFTLIELIVVVTIIMVLVAILLPSLNAAKERARTVKCASMLNSEYQAMVAYSTDWGGYAMPARTVGPPGDQNYGGQFYGPLLLGGYWGRAGANLGLGPGSVKSVVYLTQLSKMFRCPSTATSLAEFYSGTTGEFSTTETVVINGETIGATDVDHASYTYNENCGWYTGNGAGTGAVVFNPPIARMGGGTGPNYLRRDTLLSLESHGGADKGESDSTFNSTARLLSWPPAGSSIARKSGNGWGQSPLAGHPHYQSRANDPSKMAQFGTYSWKSNMLFGDGSIVLDNPYKMGTDAAGWASYNWIVDFRDTTPRTVGFPF